jgi:hypothetical protein
VRALLDIADERDALKAECEAWRALDDLLVRLHWHEKGGPAAGKIAVHARRLRADNEARERGDDVNATHAFVGRLDRHCEVCGKPDRHPIHATNDGRTHWDGCEQEHHGCALAELDAGRARIAELETQLAAWHEVFGASQLTHAIAALDALKRDVAALRAERQRVVESAPEIHGDGMRPERSWGASYPVKDARDVLDRTDPDRKEAK